MCVLSITDFVQRNFKSGEGHSFELLRILRCAPERLVQLPTGYCNGHGQLENQRNCVETTGWRPASFPVCFCIPNLKRYRKNLERSGSGSQNTWVIQPAHSLVQLFQFSMITMSWHETWILVHPHSLWVKLWKGR